MPNQNKMKLSRVGDSGLGIRPGRPDEGVQDIRSRKQGPEAAEQHRRNQNPNEVQPEVCAQKTAGVEPRKLEKEFSVFLQEIKC